MLRRWGEMRQITVGNELTPDSGAYKVVYCEWEDVEGAAYCSLIPLK